MRIVIGLLTVLLLAAGCITHKPDMTDRFPAGLETMCQQQMTRAKLAIERCGSPLVKKGGVHVSLHKGTQKINGMWCWELSPGYWIAGVITGSADIEVGCHPQTFGEVSAGVVYHEMGHYWLGTNYSIHGHDPKYDPAFHWSTLALPVTLDEAVEGTNIVVHY